MVFLEIPNVPLGTIFAETVTFMIYVMYRKYVMTSYCIKPSMIKVEKFTIFCTMCTVYYIIHSQKKAQLYIFPLITTHTDRIPKQTDLAIIRPMETLAIPIH